MFTTIVIFISKLKGHLLIWQTLVGSMIGAITPLFILWWAEKNKKRKESKEYLYYLQRIIVDQINSLLDIRVTTEKFLNDMLNPLLKSIENDSSQTYSITSIFFPLFSARSIPDDINNKTSGSGYIDNKVAKIYSLSKDLPHIIDDLRLQLQSTVDKNDKVAFEKVNSPETQKSQYKTNLNEYKKLIERDILGTNIPLYLKKLIETLVAVQERSRISPIIWQFTFSPDFKFYIKKRDYIKAKENIIDSIDLYFKERTDKRLKELEEEVKKQIE